MPRPKILLVDDNRLFIEMEKDFLQPCAVMIYTARDGQEALDMVRMIHPDLIFMDLHMPQMNGADCCAAIKADPDLKNVPVVMVVTNEKDDDLLRCYRSGCNQVITKPVDRASFIKAGHKFVPGIDWVETRIPFLTLVVFRLGRESCYGTSANLSNHGMFIAYEGNVEVDDLIHLNFLVPGSDGMVVQATGRIAWRNAGSPLCKPGLPKGFGVEFTSIDSEGVHVLADFIVRARDGKNASIIEGAYMGETVF